MENTPSIRIQHTRSVTYAFFQTCYCIISGSKLFKVASSFNLSRFEIRDPWTLDIGHWTLNMSQNLEIMAPKISAQLPTIYTICQVNLHIIFSLSLYYESKSLPKSDILKFFTNFYM
ncbi:unnamed protein product [Ambrosiozyma monospora]|uniref:Unnamed protein product n=1 Tax=Ambrosiozyma monospora TaxID=43982 RepID=A0A9W6Z2M9_AMBMO|nr:unnamed protein product [Ambrosiozyma monospora]